MIEPEMLVGQPPAFDHIVERLKRLEHEINHPDKGDDAQADASAMVNSRSAKPR